MPAPLHNTCPHCGGPAQVRTSLSITPTFRTIYIHCKDEAGCGHVYVGNLEISHSIIPSNKPNPRVRLPVIPAVRPQKARPRSSPPAPIEPGQDPA